MILHIPHSSMRVDGLVEMDRAEENLAILTDVRTELLFSHACDRVVFSFSRFVCDVERFREGDPMERYGMGMIYARDVFGNPIRRNIPDLEVLRMYEKHHERLASAAQKQLQEHGAVLIVDCHSFMVDPDLVVLPDHGPDICIGTDPFHTPQGLTRLLIGYFRSCGLRVAENDPYSGTMVPVEYLHKEKRVKSIMLEVNKRVYQEDFAGSCAVIEKALELIEQFERVALRKRGHLYLQRKQPMGIRERVQNVLAKELKIEAAMLTGERSLYELIMESLTNDEVEDLPSPWDGLRPIDLTALSAVLDIEEEFGIDFSDKEAQELFESGTVGDLVQAVSRLVDS